MRLIDGDALMRKLEPIIEAENQIYGKESWGFASKCITVIEDAPTIEERKKGKWIVHYECPKCGEITKDFKEYCPFCGADMIGEQE